jgi:trimeric autotransporter adhesin
MIKHLAAALVLTLLLCGCGGGSSSHPVTLVSITVTAATTTIAPGTTTPFKATGVNSDGSPIDLTSSVVWSSSAPAVAAVNDAGTPGLVRGMVPGSSRIIAVSGGVSGETQVTVALPQSITVTPESAVSIVGTSQQFKAVGTFPGGATQDLTPFAAWSTSDPNLATISAAALASAGVSAGPVTVSASLGGISGTATLTVATVVSISVTPGNPTLDAGVTQQFKASGTLSDPKATVRDITTLVTWSSGNLSILGITTNGGFATALSPGSTTVSAAFGAQTSSGAIPVVVLAPTQIVISPLNQNVVSGSTQQFTATGSFTDGTRDLTNLVTWSSTVPAVATFNNASGPQGLASTLSNANGSTIISATLGSGPTVVTGSTSLAVKTLVSLSVSPANPSVGIGATLQLTATGTFFDNSTQDLTNSAVWSFAPAVPAVLSVSNATGTKGLVTATALGSASVTATFGGKSGSTTVTVNPINRAYVTNFNSNTLSVIDTVSNTRLLPDIVVGTGPQGVAINPALNRAYVASNDGNLSVVDLTSNTVVATISLGGGGGSWGVGVLPAANRVYVTNSFGGTLSVVDTTPNTATTNKVIATIRVGNSPKGVAVNPVTNRVYVANSGDNTVSVINAVSNAVDPSSPIGVGSAPLDISLNPGTNRAYVANGFSSIISVIDTTTNAVKQVSVGTFHRGITVNPSTNRAYVVNSDIGSISVIDINTANNVTNNTELASPHSPIPVGTAPQGIAVNVTTNRVYVVNNGSNTVSVINAEGDRDNIVATIQVGGSPTDIAVLP